MSYAVKDISVHDGAPIECYEFIASHKTWYLTSYHTAVTVDGQEYTPVPLTRTALELTSVIDSPRTMDFNVPSDHELARTFCFGISPKELEVVVRRVHEGDDFATDFRIEWRGYITGTALAGKWGVIKTTSLIQTQLNGFLSSVYYQKSCNHVLYDVRCKAVRADFTEEAIVTLVQSQIITVDDQVYADGQLVNGTMTNTRTGEQQGIIDNTNNEILIGYPFFDIIVGDTVELTLGCNHQRLGDCKVRFDNVVNYGGTDFVPEINPFEKLAYVSTTTTEIEADGDLSFRIPIRVVGGTSTRSSGGRRTTESNTLIPSMRVRPEPVNSRSVKFEKDVSEGSGNIPAATLGIPVSAILGRKRVPNHNLLWTGNLRPLIEVKVSTKQWTEEIYRGGGYTETITHTETITTTTTIGYLCDILLGVCLGPDVHLRKIYVDGNIVWEGDAGPARTQIDIPDGPHFISNGTVFWHGGAYDQEPDPLITVADFPGHVGIAVALLKDVRADLAMGQLSFEVVRIPNPLGLASGINRIGDDLNVVSAAVEVITNEWGYAGLGIEFIDEATLTTMAVTIANEENICSIKIDNDVSAAAVLSTLQTQADMVLYEDPEVGLVTGQLIRVDSLVLSSVRRFYTNNIIELRNFDKVYWDDTIQQARGIYTERDADYNEIAVFLQNVANISQSGRSKRTVTIAYEFVPNKTLCLELLGRDLGELAAPTYSFGILTTRDGALCVPGDIISVTWPDASLLNVLMEVQSVRKQDINFNSVLLTLKQAKFPRTSLYGEADSPYDPGFDTSALTPTGATIITAPYYMVRSRNGTSTTDSNPVNYPLFLPYQANDLQYSFAAYLNNQPDTDEPALILNGASYACRAQLNGTIDRLDGFDTGEMVDIVIDNVFNSGVLRSIDEAGVRAGRLFMFIGNEIMSFEDVVDNLDGTWTLGTVYRALLDTVFEDHANDTPVFIVSNNFNFVSKLGFEQPVGYTPNWSIVSSSVVEQGRYSDGFISTDWAPTVLRTLAPLRPHNTMVGDGPRSELSYLTIGATETINWATRSRASIDVKLMLDASEAGEINGEGVQVHRVILIDSGANEHDCGVTVTDVDTLAITVPSADLGEGELYVQAELTINGVTYTSIYQDRIPVYVIAGVLRVTEDGDARVTEDDDIRIVEP